MINFPPGGVPVRVAAKVYGKDPNWVRAQLRAGLLVEEAARNTDEVLGPYVLLAATKGGSYENLRLMHNIPCCRDVYYDKLRKFYYILSQLRR